MRETPLWPCSISGPVTWLGPSPCGPMDLWHLDAGMRCMVQWGPQDYQSRWTHLDHSPEPETAEAVDNRNHNLLDPGGFKLRALRAARARARSRGIFQP